MKLAEYIQCDFSKSELIILKQLVVEELAKVNHSDNLAYATELTAILEIILEGVE